MGRTLLVVAMVLGTALTACTKGPQRLDLPIYPGSSIAAPTPDRETAGGIISRSRRQTPDGVQTVTAFLRKELVEKLGWTETGNYFSNGNLTVLRPGQVTAEASVADPTRPGGFVTVFEGYNVTYIETWEHVPTVK